MTELFTFLVCLLRCPALPLSEALFHGGKGEPGDSRISTERALFLALPDEEKEPGEGFDLYFQLYVFVIVSGISREKTMKTMPIRKVCRCCF